MKRIILLTASILLLSGCVLLEKFDNCDAACEERSRKNAEIAKTVVSVGYPVAGGAAATFVYIISRAILGKKKEEK